MPALLTHAERVPRFSWIDRNCYGDRNVRAVARTRERKGGVGRVTREERDGRDGRDLLEHQHTAATRSYTYTEQRERERADVLLRKINLAPVKLQPPQDSLLQHNIVYIH